LRVAALTQHSGTARLYEVHDMLLVFRSGSLDDALREGETAGKFRVLDDPFDNSKVPARSQQQQKRLLWHAALADGVRFPW